MPILNVQGTYLNQGVQKYSDVNASVVGNSNYELVYDIQAIEGSILHILGTNKKSRVFRRTFGSYLEDHLFDPIDDTTADLIQRELIIAIEEWEPRVKIESASVKPDFPNQQYYARISYFIPVLNRSAQLTFNLAKS